MCIGDQESSKFRASTILLWVGAVDLLLAGVSEINGFQTLLFGPRIGPLHHVVPRNTRDGEVILVGTIVMWAIPTIGLGGREREAVSILQCPGVHLVP